MLSLRTSLLVGFLCASVSSHGMFPFISTVCDTASNIMQLENKMSAPRAMGILGSATSALGETTLFSVSAAFDCFYDRFQCINETHSTCKEYCVPRRVVSSGYYDESLDTAAHHTTNLTYCMRIVTAIMPAAFYGAARIGAICRRTPLRFKELAKFTAYSTLYTAGCLYAFENYSDRGEAAYWLTGSLMAIGNSFIIERLAQ